MEETAEDSWQSATMATPSDSLSAPFGRNFEGLDGSWVTDPAQSELQLSGIAEGFFVPAFFVLLGAELDFRVLASDPRAIMLAVVMGAAAIAIHVGAALLAAPTPRAAFGLAASAQLGLPAAAASPGLSTGHLSAALAAAVVAAGCITVLPASLGTRRLADSLLAETSAAKAPAPPLTPEVSA